MCYDLLTSCCVEQIELNKAGVIVSQDETVFSVVQNKVVTYFGPWVFWNCVCQHGFFSIVLLIYMCCRPGNLKWYLPFERSFPTRKEHPWLGVCIFQLQDVKHEYSISFQTVFSE